MGYSNNDLTGFGEDRKSNPAILFYVNDSLIIMASQKQKVVVLS